MDLEGLALARRIIWTACPWLGRARPAPGSDRVLMHVAGQFDPPGDPHRFTGRHMLRSHIPFEAATTTTPAFIASIALSLARSLPQAIIYPAATTTVK